MLLPEGISRDSRGWQAGDREQMLAGARRRTVIAEHQRRLSLLPQPDRRQICAALVVERIAGYRGRRRDGT
jgi:hypothetical protein